MVRLRNGAHKCTLVCGLGLVGRCWLLVVGYGLFVDEIAVALIGVVIGWLSVV